MSRTHDLLEHPTTARISRRRFLELTGALAGAAAFAQLRPDLAGAAPSLGDYPFTLGSPRAIRCRTGSCSGPGSCRIYEPDGGMPPAGCRSSGAWPPTRTCARRPPRAALALPELAHSVHVELDGLEPGREYFYQFSYRDELSPVGRTRTAPAARERVRSLAFAFASCQAGTTATTPPTGTWPRRTSTSSSTSATTSTSTASTPTAASGTSRCRTSSAPSA